MAAQVAVPVAVAETDAAASERLGRAVVELIADAAVVGTSLVDRLARNLDADGKAKPGLVDAVLADIRALAEGVRGARR